MVAVTILERGGWPPVEVDVELEPTDHPDLLTVRVSGAWVGSLRRVDGMGWMALGAFAFDPDVIPDHADNSRKWDYVRKAPKRDEVLPAATFYNSYWEDKDDAATVLVTAWVDALARAIRRLKLRRESREMQYRRQHGQE